MLLFQRSNVSPAGLDKAPVLRRINATCRAAGKSGMILGNVLLALKCRLGSVGRTNLTHDVPDMSLHCIFAHL